MLGLGQVEFIRSQSTTRLRNRTSLLYKEQVYRLNATQGVTLFLHHSTTDTHHLHCQPPTLSSCTTNLSEERPLPCSNSQICYKPSSNYSRDGRRFLMSLQFPSRHYRGGNCGLINCLSPAAKVHRRP